MSKPDPPPPYACPSDVKSPSSSPKSILSFDSDTEFTRCGMFVHDYSCPELQLLNRPMRLCFANPKTSYLSRLLSYQRQRFLSLPRCPAPLDGLFTTRTCRDFTSFNIYPTTTQSLQVNHLLWHTARTGAYHSSNDSIFGCRVLAIGIAPDLYAFLTNVSLEEMHTATVDFLVLLQHQLTCDGDHVGLERLREDLVPHLYAEVEANIGSFPNGEPTEDRRAAVLERLVQMSFMTPWRVDVFAVYLTSADMDRLRVGLTVTGGCEQHSEPLCGVVMAKLFRDWVAFSRTLGWLGLSNIAMTEAMERAVSAKKSTGLFEQAWIVLKLQRSKRYSISVLPIDVVEQRIVPWIIRLGCEAIPPRRRRLASMKSLLELSAQFLQDLRMGNGESFHHITGDDQVSLPSLSPRHGDIHSSRFSIEEEGSWSLERLPWNETDLSNIETSVTSPIVDTL